MKAFVKWLLGLWNQLLTLFRNIFLPAPSPWRISVVRPDDLVVLEFELINFRLWPAQGNQGPRLERADGNKPVYIVVHFPAQNIAEEAFFESAGEFKVTVALSFSQDLDKQDLGNLRKELETQYRIFLSENAQVPTVSGTGPPWQITDGEQTYTVDRDAAADKLVITCTDPQLGRAGSHLSGPSRLVFYANQFVKPIDYTLEGLLGACSRYALIVAPAALPPLQPAQPISWSHLYDHIEILKHAAALEPGPGGGHAVITLTPQEQVMLKERARAWRARSSLTPYLQPPSANLPQPASPLPGLPVEVVEPEGPRVLREPAPAETSIEAPFRLIISPDYNAVWAHAPGRVVSPTTGRVELWHTRLAGRDQNGHISEKGAPAQYIRAIWTRSPDFDASLDLIPKHDTEPFRMSLDACDRYNIVHLSANFNIYHNTYHYAPRPVRAEQLMLTSLGAWMNVRGAWDLEEEALKGTPLSVSEWRHRGTMGRDHYVRVVYEGFLFPFGHRAALIKITERKFHPNIPGNVAYLRQRMFIVVREPLKFFVEPTGLTTGEGVPFDRHLPFTSVRITTLVTPNLDPPGEPYDYDKRKQSLFWPRVAGQYFQFHVIAEDSDAHQIEFTAPLVFVAKDANTKALMDTVAQDYRNGEDSRRTRPINGQPVTFAPSIVRQDGVGSTCFETQSLTFDALIPEELPEKPQATERIEQGLPCFYPALREAVVFIPDLKYLAGHTDVATITYHDVYLRHGMDSTAGSNPGEVFAQLKAPIALDFKNQADRSGALVTPSMEIAGLSRQVGPVAGDLSTVAQGTFSPVDLFKNKFPKLLGAIDLTELLQSGGLDQFPRMLTQEGADETRYTCTWDVALDSSSLSNPILATNPSTQLTLTVTTTVSRDGQEPEVNVDCWLKYFALNLSPPFNFFTLDFDHIHFLSQQGRKAEVDVKLNGVGFGGDLAFIERLRNLILLDGFCDPPALEVTAEGIAASYSLTLPSLAVGIFSLQNISLGAALSVPFTEKPLSVRFNFCERHSPFLLSVALFGGGGFFAIAIDTEGVQVLEAALEFGASISIDFGVASGGVYAMGGIYFKKAQDQAVLAGYFRMGGELDVLGLISASIELYLELRYDNGEAVGSATLSIEVEVLFFSITVEISCERRFAGSQGDPTFDDMLGKYYIDSLTRVVYQKPGAQPGTQEPLGPSDSIPAGAIEVNPWFEYCRAFARKEW
jgi:hypothetical protein